VTPGAVDARLTDDVLTSPKFRTSEVRDVPRELRIKVFADYGMDYWTVDRSKFEVDHFIPIGLGGASVEQNLWPEPRHDVVDGCDLGAITKDRLEEELIDEVRDLKISPGQAREVITSNWVEGYKRYVGVLPRAREGRAWR
jgi:hypothetical protein